MNEREVGKTEKYKVHKDEITRMWGMKEVIVIPVVEVGLDAISTDFEKYIAAIGIEMRVEHTQKNSFIRDIKNFETGTWVPKKTLLVSMCKTL